MIREYFIYLNESKCDIRIESPDDPIKNGGVNGFTI